MTHTNKDGLRKFPSIEAAQAYMAVVMHEMHRPLNNTRFAWDDDITEMAAYEEVALSYESRNSFDEKVEINGRLAWVGCN